MVGPRRVVRLVVAGIGVLCVVSSIDAGAGEAVGITTPKPSGYWTPERLRNAEPMALPNVNTSPTSDAAPPEAVPQSAAGSAVPQSASVARKPKLKPRPDRKNRLFKPRRIRAGEIKATDAIVPEAAGVVPAPYSSSRIVPQSGDSAYPYSTVGRLFFTVPAGADANPGDRFCSAAVVGRRVALTAGHCLHSGKNGAGGWYTNWHFIPAYRDGVAPFETWDATEAKVTKTWMEGQGVFPNAADYGLLVFADRDVGGRVRKLGNTVGTLGMDINLLQSNHVHMLGYPCNIDNCDKMHQVTAQSYRSVEPNNVEYGSDMGPGSSGGPWIQNFGIAGTGQTPGVTQTGMNRVVGLTSYGFNSTSLLVQGSPNLDGRLWELWNEVCAVSGNC